MLLVMCTHRASLGLIAHRGMQGNGQVMVIFPAFFSRGHVTGNAIKTVLAKLV